MRGTRIGFRGSAPAVLAAVAILAAVGASACNDPKPLPNSSADATGPRVGLLPGERPVVVPGPDLGEAWTTEPDPAMFNTLDDGTQVASDQVLVMMDPSSTRADADRVAAAVHGTVGGHIAYIGLWKLLVEPVYLEGVPEARLAALAKQEGVLAAAPVALESVQDDADCAAALADPVYSGSNSTAYDTIGVKDAWQALSAAALPVDSVHVGVFDSVLTHDPQGRIPWDFGGVSFVGDPKTTPDPRRISEQDPDTDGFHHADGTLGIIAGNGESGGAAGVASPLGSRLLVSQESISGPTDDGQTSKWANSDRFSYTDLTLVATIREIESGATIVTTSVSATTVVPANAPGAAIWKQLYGRLAADHPNVLIVVAAGNNGAALDGSNYYPGGIASPNVITVGNVDAGGSRHSTSDSFLAPGEVTLGAPGENAVWGAGADGRVRATNGGTSSATAMVAGTAAVIRAIAPTMTAEEIKKMLADTAAPGDPNVGGKTLSMGSAVRETIDNMRAKQSSPLPPLTDAEIAAGRQYCEINVTAALTQRLVQPVGSSRWEIRASVHAAKGPTTLSLVEGGLRPTNWRQPIQGSAQAVSWTILVPKEGATIVVSRQDNGYWVKYTVRDNGEATPSPEPSAPASPILGPTVEPPPTPAASPNGKCKISPPPGSLEYIKWQLECNGIPPPAP